MLVEELNEVLVSLSLLVMLANNVSMQKWEKKATRERDEAQTIALTDPLTGVKSKHTFIEKEEEIDRALKNG